MNKLCSGNEILYSASVGGEFQVLLNENGRNTLVLTYVKFILLVYFRKYNVDEGHKTQNDHFLYMLDKVNENGSKPIVTIFDMLYASVHNIKGIR